MSDDLQPLIIYHADCYDGFTAAWCAWLEFGDNAEYRPMAYSDDPPTPDEVEGREVYVLDFSFDWLVVDRLSGFADKLVLLDHHETAFENLSHPDAHDPEPPHWTCTSSSGLIVELDQSRSGAHMAWDWFYPDDDVPRLVEYVEDRDLWNWDLPESRAVNAAIQSYDFGFYRWSQWDGQGLEHEHRFFPTPTNDDGKLVSEGEAILRAKERAVNRIIGDDGKHVREVCIGGYKALAINSPIYQSSIGNKLAEMAEGSIGIVWHEHPTGEKCSLRSTDDGPNVAEIAEEFGGGGHPNAAGFTFDSSDWKIQIRSGGDNE